MKDPRPMNLDLTKFRFPVPAVVSILHRISGVIVFLLIPLLLWLLQQVLAGSSEFDHVHQLFDSIWFKLLIWIIIGSLLYHLVAGIRHLIMDCGFAESKKGGRITSVITLVISIILIILLGVWLW